MGNPQQIWHSRPIFLSSTFRDMHAERDYLHTHVFPRLEERLRERCHYLEVIDLRWGVETQSLEKQTAKEILVLKVCLNEIERSRPFLIVLLGDRYGWIPPSDRMNTAAREAGFEGDLKGRSVTELEIDFGVLSNPDQQSRSHFYFRDPLPYDEMPAHIATMYSEAHTGGDNAETRANKLGALKKKIWRETPERCRSYAAAWDPIAQTATGLDAWGKMVFEDLWSDLEAETATLVREENGDWRDEESWILQRFASDRSRDFVGRTDIIRQLFHDTSGEHRTNGFYFTGTAGSGKSSLFAEVYRRAPQEGYFVLAHAAGISPASIHVNSMLLRWISQLVDELDVRSPLKINATNSEIDGAFSSLIKRMCQRQPVLLLIDALNEFAPTPRDDSGTIRFQWLPGLVPENARLIATSMASSDFAHEAKDLIALANYPGIKYCKLPPFEREEAGEAVAAICRRYHRTLHPSILVALLDKRYENSEASYGSPLWLTMAAEELNLLDADDFARTESEFTGTADDRLRQLLMTLVLEMPSGVENLYNWMIDRAEQAFGKLWTKTFLSLIALSRSGWRESDFRLLIPRLVNVKWDDLHFAALRRIFRAHLVQRGNHAQWDFSHAQMCQAVVTRVFGNEEDQQKFHGRIADLLETLPSDDPLHISETMVHHIKAADPVGAALYLGSGLSTEEQSGAIDAMIEQLAMPDSYWVTLALTHPGLNDYERETLYTCVVRDFYPRINEGHPGHDRHQELLDAMVTCGESILTQNPANLERQRDLSVCHSHRGDLREMTYYWSIGLGGSVGDPAWWQKDHEESLALIEPVAASDPSNTLWQRDLAKSMDKSAYVLNYNDDYASALEMYEKSHAIKLTLFLDDASNEILQQDLSVGLKTIGDMCQAQNDPKGAVLAYEGSIDLAEKLFSKNILWGRELLERIIQFGNLFKKQGALEEAVNAQKKCLSVIKLIAAADPYETWWRRQLIERHLEIGEIRIAQKDYVSALAALETSLSTVEELAAANPTSLEWPEQKLKHIEKIGEIKERQGDYHGLAETLEMRLSTIDNCANADPDNIKAQIEVSFLYRQLGDARQRMGDPDRAMVAFNSSLSIAEKFMPVDPPDDTWEWHLYDLDAKVNDGHKFKSFLLGLFERQGDAKKALGDFDGALKAYDIAYSGTRQLVKEDSSTHHWQDELSDLAKKIDDIRGDT